MTSITDVNPLTGNVTAVGISKIDDIVVTGILSTGVNDIELQQFKTFPNPSTSSFSVSLPKGISSLEIYNNIGKLVYKTIPEKEIIIIGKSLPAGIYFVKATTNNGTQVIKHIIK